MINPELDQAIMAILKQGSLSEFELIKTLQKPPYSLFKQDLFANELSLFQTHFVIHNTLYRLRDIGLAQGCYDIDTLTTQLSLIPFCQRSEPKGDLLANTSQLTANERPEVLKLREYYLDWRNFEQTGQQNVADLLSRFWQTYSQFGSKQQKQQLQFALNAMGFEQIPSQSELKAKYKQQSIQLHPDKGGSAEEFHLLQQHYQFIKALVR